MTNDIIKTHVAQIYDAPGREMVEEDFEEARKNLHEIIRAGQESIAQLVALADQSQNDKYYAALSSLMKTVVDANEKLLVLQEKIRYITKKEESKVINNNLIITTDELQQMITNNARRNA